MYRYCQICHKKSFQLKERKRFCFEPKQPKRLDKPAFLVLGIIANPLRQQALQQTIQLVHKR